MFYPIFVLSFELQCISDKVLSICTKQLHSGHSSTYRVFAHPVPDLERTLIEISALTPLSLGRKQGETHTATLLCGLIFSSLRSPLPLRHSFLLTCLLEDNFVLPEASRRIVLGKFSGKTLLWSVLKLLHSFYMALNEMQNSKKQVSIRMFHVVFF